MRPIDFFDRGANRFPDRDFLVAADERRTYREVQQSSHHIASALQAAGLTTDAKAAVYSGNDLRAFECVLGIFRSGYPWVPVNARNSVSENAYIVDSFDVEALFYHSDYEEQVEQVRRECPKLRLVICVDRVGKNAPALEKWCEGAATQALEVPDSPERVVAILSSGGTTGKPKGIVWPSRVFETMTASFYLSMPVSEPPVHLAAAPLTHAAGSFALMLSAEGATNIILKQADPLTIMETIQQQRVSHLYLPPTVIYMVLAHPRLREFDYSSLRHFIYGAAPMSVDKLKHAMEVFGPALTQVYGQAEAPNMCTYLSPADHLGPQERLASCGRPTLLTPLAIMDDEGRLLRPGERGEIVVRGSLVMSGYYKNPPATAEATANGWHRTGDLGFKDADGYVYIVDRKKDMIISGGFNVYPGEVEQVIWAHPAVQDCAVIGVPDDKWGEAVKAVVELRPGHSVSEAELIALCKDKVGGVKAPKTIEFWPSLPRTAVGKVRKKDIRAPFWEAYDRKI